MASPVTDPNLIAQLEAAPVTDPALLAQLENNKPPADWKDRVQAHQAGVWNAAAHMAGAIPDAAMQVWRLGKAAVGAAGYLSRGESPPDWLQTSGSNTPTGDWFAQQLDKLHNYTPTTADRPEDPWSQRAATVSGVLPWAALGGGGSVANSLKGTAAAAVPAIAGQAVAEAKPFGTTHPLAESGNVGTAALVQALAASTPHTLAGAAKPMLRGGASPQDIRSTINEFQGVTGRSPTWGQATGSPAIQGAEQMVGSGFGGMGPFNTQSELAKTGAETYASNLVDALGGVRSKGDAGRNLQEGIKEFKSRTLDDPNSTYKTLQSKADKLVPAGTMVQPTQSVPAFQNAAAPIGTNAPALRVALQRPYAAKVAAALVDDSQISPSGGIPYPQFRAARAAIGEEAFPSSPLLINPDTASLRQGYHAMNQDLADALRNSPVAAAAQSRADQYYGAAKDRLENLANLSDQQFPEQAFNRFYGAVKDQNLTQLRAVKRSLEPDQYKAQVSTILDGLGRATNSKQNAANDAFSFNTLMTNYSALRPEVRSELFSGYPGAPQIQSSMDRLASVADRINTGSKVLQSTSGTGPYEAGHNETLGFGGALLTGHPAVAAAFAFGPAARFISSRTMMTNPNFMNWLASSASVLPKNAAAHLGALDNLITNEPDPQTRNDMQTYRSALGSQ
jgi:hypothetical protein